jgi:DNA-binding transcriptional regulator/RsmH inhibitor MraZ
VGLYDRLEIWNPDTWRLHLSELEDEHEMSLGKVLQLPSIKPPLPGEASRL